MAVLKHLPSKNMDYSRIIDYLLFQHNEKSGKPILDDQGRMILREEYYIGGILCEPMAFDQECKVLNDRYNKNKSFNEIKSHHYIVSFDPRDVTENGLTGKKAQELSMEYAKKCFPGHQALVVTHTDGHNHSGNIHSHIVINSLRKRDIPQEKFMSQASEYKSGFKHHLTKAYLEHIENFLMEMCRENGLHQVDILTPAAAKVTQKEYLAGRRGQEKLEALNWEITEDGLKPATTQFQTQKQKLRNAVDDISRTAVSFEDFKSLLSEKYDITVEEKRGRLGYHYPGREKHISERALGAHYGRKYLFEVFEKNRRKEQKAAASYRKDPVAIFYYPSRLRLVVDLQTCLKAQENQTYARKVKISNLKKMADTLIFLQENNFDSREQLLGSLAEVTVKLKETETSLHRIQDELKDINRQIHFTGQYLANKKAYQQMLKSLQKGLYRKRHGTEIKAYEEARQYLKERFPDSHVPSIKVLKEKKEELLGLKTQYKRQARLLGQQKKDLSVIISNVDAILDDRVPEKPAKQLDR